LNVWQFCLLICFIVKGSVLASIGIVATLDKSRAIMPSTAAKGTAEVTKTHPPAPARRRNKLQI